MKRRKIIPYNPKLKEYARQLRNNSTEAEIFLWLKLKGKQLYGYDFHRQKPIDNYILDFFCQELMLGIEVDGYSHELVEVYKKDKLKEKRINELDISILRFTDNQVKNDMENVLRAIEYYVFNFERHTPNPSQEGNK
jgi:very-short-patch-repair endonuclease